MRDTAFEKTREQIAKRALPCFVVSLLMTLLIVPAFAGDKEKDEDTLRQANIVLQDMLNGNSISPAVLSKADCVVILPNVKKFGLGIGGSGGRGPMLCRTGANFKGKWSAPAMYSIGGASLGLQVGGSSSDFVLLLMDQKVVDQVINGKTKMGADATAAAGPGATAAGPVDNADILTYGRAKGLFAGVSLGSATLSPDSDANNRLYGKQLSAADIVRSNTIKPPAGGESLVSLLNSKIAKHSD
jgi:lipid-binding SYLF domain-containing protein